MLLDSNSPSYTHNGSYIALNRFSLSYVPISFGWFEDEKLFSSTLPKKTTIFKKSRLYSSTVYAKTVNNNHNRESSPKLFFPPTSGSRHYLPCAFPQVGLDSNSPSYT
ncbi:hypothetical protein G9A89_022591 [Geosiphon pyriformis]|nr:hypothetical protein G9A89_022591 [Geosiphon pyriformis]